MVVYGKLFFVESKFSVQRTTKNFLRDNYNKTISESVRIGYSSARVKNPHKNVGPYSAHNQRPLQSSTADKQTK